MVCRPMVFELKGLNIWSLAFLQYRPRVFDDAHSQPLAASSMQMKGVIALMLA